MYFSQIRITPCVGDLATSGLFDILNRINIANLWSTYAAIRAYLKNCILWKLAFYNFCWRLDFQLLELDWATSGLVNILNRVDIANPLPIDAATRAYLEIVFYEILHFPTFARDLVFSLSKSIYQLWAYLVYWMETL